MIHQTATTDGAIQLEPGYTIERIVAGSGLHTANGIAFGTDGRLYVASVPGESIFALDTATGVVTVEVEPFAGEADDLVFTPEGDLIWTAFLEGAVRRRDPDGGLRDLATGLPGINGIALTRDGARLFASQVFMGEGLWEIDLAGVAPPRLVADHVEERLHSSSPQQIVWGGAAYAAYQITPQLSVAARGEFLDDRDGLYSGVGQKLEELTLTLGYQPLDGFLLRSEFRQDFSNQPFFYGNALGRLMFNQPTLGFGAVWWFGQKQGAW